MPQARELDWLQHSVGVVALGDRTIITVGGDDATEWLQGQVTNQIEGVTPGSSVYAFVLTLKGRVMADVWALVREDEIWLDVPSQGVDELMARLDRYIIMEDVDLAHRDDLRVIAAQGPRADEVADGGRSVDRLGVGGRQWVIPVQSVADELERLTGRARALGGGAVSEEAWAHAHVLLGRPRFGIDFGEHTYPQETGLHHLAVSFNKGCYVGQETVVMLENRGKAPKVLWRWSVDGGQSPAPKTPIVLEGAPVGEITSAVAGDTGIAALGFLKRGHERAGQDGFAVDGRPARALGPVQVGRGA